MKISNKDISKQFETITKALQRFENGASIEQIIDALDITIKLRTLQRRLAKLKEQGKVITSGDTRSTRYHLATQVFGATAQDKEKKKENANTIPLSTDGKEVLVTVSLSETERIPVGYNRDFLLNYRPNIDRYLSKTEKQKLAKIGQTGKSDQPAGTYAKEILNRLLIDLSWNSSRLEGNTYSLLDTERLISLGEAAETKSAMEAQMILNHKDAIEFLVEGADDIGFNRYTVLNLHALLSNNLLPDPAASGRLRRFNVGINRSVYTPPGIPQQIEKFFEIILEKASGIEDPFEQAFFVMVQLPYLQPFDDVNKRVSRLAANIPFNRLNLAPLSFIDVPNDIYIKGILSVYELNRIELIKDVFMWAYERSSMRYAALQQSLGEPDLFRLKYRNAIKSLIGEIVSNLLSHKEASLKIAGEARKLPEIEQNKFIDAVETELISLHEGNFARYWIRPAEFKAWKEVWAK